MVSRASAGRAAERSRAPRRPGLRARRRLLVAAAASFGITLLCMIVVLRRGDRGTEQAARAEACVAKAVTNLGEGDTRDALHWAELATALDPASANGQRLAGGARAALGDLRRAFDRFEAAALAAPADAEAALSAGLAAKALARRTGEAAFAESARTWLRHAVGRADAAAARAPHAAVPRFVAAAACLASDDPGEALLRLHGVVVHDDSEHEQLATLRAAAEAAAGQADAALHGLDDALGAGASPAACQARAKLAALCEWLRGSLRERALRALAAGHPDTAATMLVARVQERPGDAAALAALATSLHAAGRASEVTALCDRLRAVPGGEGAAAWFAAHARRAAGDPHGALTILEPLRAQQPTNAAAVAAILACSDAIGEPARGLAAAERSAAHAPADLALQGVLGAARERTGDVAGAITAYRAAIVPGAAQHPAAEPAGAQRLARDRLVDLLLRIGRADEALHVADGGAVRGAAGGARGPASVRRAHALLATGRIAEAEAEYLAVASAEPGCAAALVGAARAAWLRGDPDAARGSLDAAFDADPESAEAWTLLLGLSATPDARRAVEARLAAAIVARPGSAALVFAAGVAAEARDELELAARHYRASLAIAPRSVPARNNLAWVLAAGLGRPADARPHAEGALADAPTSPQVADTAGWTRFLDGDEHGAEPLLAAARRGLPRRAPVALRHARVLAALGRLPEARAALDAASAADPAIRADAAYRETSDLATVPVPAVARPVPAGRPHEGEVPR